MNNLSLDMIPKKNLQQSTPGLGMSYPETVALFERMKEQDQRVVYHTIRPMGDEVWNIVDGVKTIREIASACVVEFGVMVDDELLLPIFEGLHDKELISF